MSEFEEGLFAWLALGETLADTRFGVAELGGGSLQVTFPCRTCEGARQVMVGGRSMAIYSHSYLDWGQDEAWKR
ncbi:MAG: nucleoside phosphatase, partial [Anaerolineales bacterium]